MVVFTIKELSYLVVTLFCDLLRPRLCLYLSYLLLCLRYLPCFRHNNKNGYAFTRHHLLHLVEAHQAKIFSNKILSLNSVLQIARFMAFC